MIHKINVRNIALIIGVSVLDIGCGIYDRVVNNSGVIKWCIDGVTQNAQNIVYSSQWNTTHVSLATSTMSGYNLFGLLAIVFVATAVTVVLMGTFSMRGGMS